MVTESDHKHEAIASGTSQEHIHSPYIDPNREGGSVFRTTTRSASLIETAKDPRNTGPLGIFLGHVHNSGLHQRFWCFPRILQVSPIA